jgi:hypothetical protein
MNSFNELCDRQRMPYAVFIFPVNPRGNKISSVALPPAFPYVLPRLADFSFHLHAHTRDLGIPLKPAFFSYQKQSLPHYYIRIEPTTNLRK